MFHLNPVLPLLNKKIPLVECYGPTIQGEGIMIGTRTVFVRTGGCDSLCKKCDSLHAVLPEEVKKNAVWLTCDELASQVLACSQGVEWITLSGGNPVIWDLHPFIVKVGLQLNKKIAVETQGTFWRDWLLICNVVTVSPKGPGMGEKPNYPILKQFVDRLTPQTHGLNFKVVIFGEDDIAFAKDIMAIHPRVPMYFQVGNPNTWPDYAPINRHTKLNLLDDLTWLAERVCKDPELDRVKVLPQLHVLMWGAERCR